MIAHSVMRSGKFGALCVYIEEKAKNKEKSRKKSMKSYEPKIWRKIYIYTTMIMNEMTSRKKNAGRNNAVS